MGKRANGASRGLNTISGKMKRTAMIMKRHEALANSQRRDFEQEDAVEAPEFRLFNSESDGPIVSWFSVREADYEVERRIINSRKPLQRHAPGENVEDFNFYKEVIPIPIRPPWTFKMSRSRLVRNEEQYFDEYLKSIYSQYAPHRLNHFEHNLQVWRQLWRVCEASDVLMVVTDARHPMFHLPPALYNFITEHVRRPLIMILNKIDLISQERQNAWISFMTAKYPKLTIFAVTSFPHSVEHPNAPSVIDTDATLRKQQSHEKRDNHPVGVDAVLEHLENLYAQIRGQPQKQVLQKSDNGSETLPSDINSKSSEAPLQSVTDEVEVDAEDFVDDRVVSEENGQNKSSDSESDSDDEDQLLRLSANFCKRVNLQPKRSIPKVSNAGASTKVPTTNSSAADVIADSSSSKRAKQWWEYEQNPDEPESSSDDDENGDSAGPVDDLQTAGADEAVENEGNRLIIGILGHPNAGKSSLINAIMGRACVGVSATPGKTKHLQTINLNNRFMLCDCPGLVFPAADMPKALQVLSGIFPLPQTREPYSIVAYLAERIPVEKIYSLKPVQQGTSAVASSGSAKLDSTKRRAKKGSDTSDKKSMLESALEMELELERERAEHIQAAAGVAVASPTALISSVDSEFKWSAWDICESFAQQKGYKLHGGGLDTYKAAHSILEDALAGVINFSFPPPSSSK